jgi:ATP-dependent RNA helicase DDX35
MVPEMQRSDLAPVILQLKALGIINILKFHFLSVRILRVHHVR